MTSPNQITTELRARLSVEATKARINHICELFDKRPPKLRTRLGKVYLTDELLDWCREAGASIDWICCGDPTSMINVFHRLSEIASVQNALQKEDARPHVQG